MWARRGRQGCRPRSRLRGLERTVARGARLFDNEGMPESRWCTRAGVVALAALAIGMAGGCASWGVVDDGTSVAWGASNGGSLLNAAVLPREGEGYVVPATWSSRGLQYGTDEMVELLVYLGRTMAAAPPGPRLAIGDVAQEGGGRSAHHRSHQNGRDVDLLFFVTDAAGRPVENGEMRRFSPDGRSGPYRFDVARNWALVRAILDNPVTDVQFLFLYDPLRQRLLDHARAIGEPDELVARAGIVLQQPGDSAPHDDHLHLRIYCSSADRAAGCSDRGDLRWAKKDAKWRPLAVARLTAAEQATAARPLPAMFALCGLPFAP
jgi:penicillin-insensitive murein DD-endopeptidase